LQILSPNLELAQKSLLRSPCARVTLITENEVSHDITKDVISFDIELSEHNQANKANLKISNKDGQYDKLNFNSTKRNWFKENNKIIIEKGNNGEYMPAGIYLIRSAEPEKYSRGAEQILSVKCFDKSKNLLKAKVTTDIYENMQANDIVADIAINHAGLNPSELNLAPLDFTIKSVQFIDELSWDAMFMPLQAALHNLYFDEEGKLRSSKINFNKTVSWTYDNSDFVIFYQPKWSDDDIKNIVRVYGRNISEPKLVPLAEKLLVTFTKHVMSGESSHTETLYYFDDHTRTAVDVRMEYTAIKEKWDTSDYASIQEKTDHYVKVKLRNKNHKSTDADITVNIYGKPLGQAAPDVLAAEAMDEYLINQYGEVEDKIDNPLIQTEQQAQYLADQRLQLHKWSRNKMNIQVVGNMAHQAGDIIEVWHPVYKRMVRLYIYKVKHQYAREKHDITDLYCYIAESI
jgi:hypothetical protein